MRPLIGCVGQGWIGKNYADEFEERGYQVVRYALDAKYRKNKKKIATCDIVFICVPTPSKPTGFDYSIVDDVLNLVGDGKIAVIKSTVLPNTTDKLQDKHDNIFIVHIPEFLTEKTAAWDVRNPSRNIIGETKKSAKAHIHEKILPHLPKAPYETAVNAKTAELIKYGGNCWFYFKVIFVNMLYDLSGQLGIDYDEIKKGLAADPRIGSTHLAPVHQGGRGAGGHCFIKDMSAFAEIYKKYCAGDSYGNRLLTIMQDKNIQLLVDSRKDLELLIGVYGHNKLK